jgi:gliding motility-associated-like protein
VPVSCYGSQTCFTDQSAIATGNISSFQWDFGDASSGASNSSAMQNSCHTFSSVSNFNVTLSVTSDNGCQNHITQPVAISPLPVAKFSVNRTCEGNSSCFNNLSSISSGSIASYNWNFDDSGSATNSSTIASPCHLFSSLNTHFVKLILTSNKGCKDSVTAPFALSPLPVPDFTSSVECPGNQTCFTDLTTIPSGTIAGYNWNFSDPASGMADSSYSQNPCHIFLNTSSPFVRLTVVSDSGCQQTITAPVSFNAVPQAAFSLPASCYGSQTCFSDKSMISSGSITSFQWYFGDTAASNSSSNQNACHLYSSNGSFNVTFSVTSDNGCADTVTHMVTVSPLPVVDFSTNKTCEGNISCFHDLSSISSGSIASYNWNFDDNGSGSNFDSVSNPCHQFTSLNTHFVKLILTSDKGCIDSVTNPFTLSPLPVSSFTSTVECPGNQTCFTDLTTIPSGTIAGYSWNFSDQAAGVADSSSLQNPCHTFINTSSPMVTLTVVSDSGCMQTFTAPVSFNAVPVSSFSFPVSCFGGQTCFTNLSSISSGTISDFSWNFGDGNSGLSNLSSIQNPCHSFSTDGSFDIMLSVTSDNGCTNDITHSVAISPLPVANFNSSVACIGSRTCFTDMSTISSGSINSYNWNFGDAPSGVNNYSAIANPCHLFNTLSTYQVGLVVISADGCSDTLISQVAISPKPIAGFTAPSVCPGSQTCFQDESSISNGYITKWKWNFYSTSSVDSSNDRNPCHVFADKYANAELTVTSNDGCEDMYADSVDFNPVPQPDFSTGALCYGSQSCFNNLSSISNGNITAFNWNFGDPATGLGNNDSSANACHDFSAAHSFTIGLNATSDLGCVGALSRPVNILRPPVADFAANAVCINAPTEFINRCLAAVTDQIANCKWSFGDGDSSNINSPLHLFNSVGTYQVALIATSAAGCIDTTVLPVTVHAKPNANISSPTENCAPVCTQFTDLSVPVEGTISGRSWKFPGGNPSSSTQQNPLVCYHGKGYYPVTLIITNSFGCSDTLHTDKQTTVYPVPDADFYVIKEPDNTIAPELDLGHLWSYDVVKWYWDFGDQSPVDSVNPDPSHAYRVAALNNNFYNFNIALTVKNQFGCVSRVSREINIQPSFSFYIPNTFTPNNDLPNEQFYGKGRGISEYKISIFDRWGLLLWTCESKGNYQDWDKDNGEGMPSACKWDGIYRGAPVQEDTYVWKVELKNVFGDSFNYVGHVNVVK